LPEPYECKDDDFDSIEELLFVRGMTPEIFYQGFEGFVTVFPKNKKQVRVKKGRSKQSKKKEFNYNKLNVNAISSEMWAALPGMTEELVSEIVIYRAEKDFNSLREVQNLIGPDVFRGISRYLTIQTTSYYKISSTGKISNSRISEGITALILISNQIREKYQIIEWVDEIPMQNRFTGMSVS